MSPRPADFPLRERGFGYPDFTVGRTFEHAKRRTVLESDNALFTTWSLALQPRYLDRPAAIQEGEVDIVVNPMLVFSMIFGLSVEDLSEHGMALLGIDDLRFRKTVHAGDTLHASTVVTARRRSSTDEKGIVTWRTTGFNQLNEVVVEFLRSNLFGLQGSQ